jgi:hypothetical protein
MVMTLLVQDGSILKKWSAIGTLFNKAELTAMLAINRVVMTSASATAGSPLGMKGVQQIEERGNISNDYIQTVQDCLTWHFVSSSKVLVEN